MLLSSKLGFDKYELKNKLAKLENNFKLASNNTDCKKEQIATEVGEVDIWDFPEEKTLTTTQASTTNIVKDNNDFIIDDFDTIDYFQEIENDPEVEEVQKEEIVIPKQDLEIENELESDFNTPTPSGNDDDKESSYPDSVVNDDLLTPSVDPDLEYDPEAATIKATINIRRKW